MDAKELGYKTFVIRDAIKGHSTTALSNMREKGINIIDSTILLQERYHCPDNFLECPTSGDCVPKENQCDNLLDCHDGYDEDPKVVISNCCDEFILSGMDTLSGLWYQQYMGIYEKISCSRLV